jgi:hypothetical protein
VETSGLNVVALNPKVYDVLLDSVKLKLAADKFCAVVADVLKV